jgi:hypothetical protein
VKNLFDGSAILATVILIVLAHILDKAAVN